MRGNQRLHAQSRRECREFAARKSAGIAGVVHDPNAHIALLGFIHKHAEKFEVRLRKIWGVLHVSAAGLHGDGLVAHGFHGIQIVANHGFVHRAAETVVGLGSIFRRRRFPLACDLRGGGHLNLQPRLLRIGWGTADSDRNGGKECRE